MDCQGDEEDSLVSKALGIFEDISGYNPDESPSNGYEYLYQVICESSKIPQTAVAALDASKFKKNQTFYLKGNDEDASVKEELLPSQEWQRMQLTDFDILRKKVKQMKVKWKQIKAQLGEPAMPSDPDSEDSWREFCSMTEPSMHSLFSMSQCGLDDLLEYFSVWLNELEMDFSNQTGMWLYAIFACLEKPLTPATCANIRSIIRSAKEKRATLESEKDDALRPINLIICIAARYFQQFDLAD